MIRNNPFEGQVGRNTTIQSSRINTDFLRIYIRWIYPENTNLLLPAGYIVACGRVDTTVTVDGARGVEPLVAAIVGRCCLCPPDGSTLRGVSITLSVKAVAVASSTGPPVLYYHVSGALKDTVTIRK